MEVKWRSSGVAQLAHLKPCPAHLAYYLLPYLLRIAYYLLLTTYYCHLKPCPARLAAALLGHRLRLQTDRRIRTQMG